MNLHKIWLIAKREYTYNFRRRSFLFTAFGIPLFTIVAMVIVFGLVDKTMSDVSSYKRVGIVDKAGVFVDSNGKSVAALPTPFEVIQSEAVGAEGVTNNTLDGYFVLAPDFMQSG